MIDDEQENTARFLAKSDGVLCGIDIALRVFQILQPQGFEATVYKHDGDLLEKGDIIAEIKGKTRALLKGERTALNLIQHMSGVATATRKAVDIVEGTNASIADTRKTLPALSRNTTPPGYSSAPSRCGSMSHHERPNATAPHTTAPAATQAAMTHPRRTFTPLQKGARGFSAI